MSKAFVIMPYEKNLNRLYSMVIQDALEKKGYTCIRQDMTGAGGHIMTNVVRNLAESDLVIAVLTDFNFNVAYELGIRHTMCRCGTVLMCDKAQEQELKFDLQGISILYYDGDWMEKFSENEIIDQLIKMIEYIEVNQATDSDNPVHDVFSKLPKSLLEIIQNNDDNSADRIQRLQEENEALKERIYRAGLSDSTTESKMNIRKLFRTAIENSVFYSDEAVDKLKELESAGKKDEFADFLGEVLEKGFLDEVDCKNVYFLCRRIGVPPLTKVFLEHATGLYPDNEELNIYLANELARNHNDREKAYIISNEMMGITKKNGKPELTKHVSEKVIGAFFDVYHKLKKFQEIISLSDVLLEEYSKKGTQSLICRNVALAYLNLDKLVEAKEWGSRAEALDPQNDVTHYILFRIYRQEEDFVNAIFEVEKCIRCDPNDENYYYTMAGFICDEHFGRHSASDEPHQIDIIQVRDYAVPFIIFVLAMNLSSPTRALHFLTDNKFSEDGQRCLLALETNKDLFEEFNDLDFSFVEFCRTQNNKEKDESNNQNDSCNIVKRAK